MTVQEIRELINLVVESGIAELEVQRGDNKVRVRRSPGRLSQEIVLPVAQPLAAVPVPSAAEAPAAAAMTAGNGPAPQEPDAGVVLVKSPIVGTYYESPSPGAPPFVKVGDRVRPGQVLCIIESMKLMNEIEAEIAGVIVSRLAQSGKPVEYGEALFGVKPL